MDNLKNCKSCGKLFLKVARDICPDCLEQEEEAFKKVKKYLDDHPKAKLQEVSTETEVSQKQIKKFIEEGRLLASQHSGLSVECNRCGAEISQGKYCDNCTEELQSGLSSSKDDKKEESDKEKPKKEPGGKVHIQDRWNRRDR